MKDKVCFKSDTSAQIIILTGFVIAIIILGMGTVLYSAANSGQQTSILQSDRAYNNFENIREEYGIALMVSSEKGEIDPFNVSNTTTILEFEDRMKTIVESHGFILNFTDHEHIKVKDRAVVNILFADGKKVFNDSVTYNLLTGKIIYDTIPPGYIYDLHAENPGCTGGDGVVELKWTAVGNDYYEDTSAYKYEIRYSNESINTSEEFDNATFYRYYYDVKKNGTEQIYYVEELDHVLWYFAIKVYDKAGNFNFSNNASAKASEWSPEVYNITANNETGNFTKDDPYQPNLFANRSDDITIKFQVRDRDNDNVTISLMVRNRTLLPTGWVNGDWFEGRNWSYGDYSDEILSYHNITEINESWDYYFNISDNSSTCPKKRSVPSGAPNNYYWIEIPYKEYTPVVFGWRFVNDTYIDEDSVNTNYGNKSTINVRDFQDLYGLIKFNLSSIPETAIIESATISLYYNATQNQNISFHRVLQDWNEDDVTWDNWYHENNYSSSVNISGDISGEQYYYWSALTDVEYFHNNSVENYGWLIKVSKNQLAEFDSKEAVNESRRPVLYVTYSKGNNTYVHPDY